MKSSGPDWEAQDDMVLFVIAVVEQMDLRISEVNLWDTSRDQFLPLLEQGVQDFRKKRADRIIHACRALPWG